MNDLENGNSKPLEIFSSLPQHIQKRLKGILHQKHYDKGTHIFVQGAFANAIYVVADGRVKISRVTKEGYESILCVRGPGDIFCPVPLLNSGDQLGTAIALSDVVLLWADEKSFNELTQESPELLSIVQSDCLFEVRRLLHRMEAFSFRSIKERLAFTLLDEIERQSSQGGAVNELHLKQHELAGLVGASRESVSRTLSKLEDEGILSIHRGRLEIHDKVKLKQLSSE